MREKFFFLLLTILFIVSGCNQTPSVSQSTAPTVSFKEPATGSSFKAGETILIRFSAGDVNGVAQIELLANGEPIKVEPVDPPVNVFSGQHSWMPANQGSYVLELRAFNVNGDVSEPTQLFVNVEQEETPPTQLPEAPTEEPPTPTATLVLATPTDTPSPTVEPTATTEVITNTPETVDVASDEAMITVVAEAIFVRSGPNTNYEQIGKMGQGDTAAIIGKDTSGAWWQIEYPPNSDSRGWVSAGGEYTAATGTDDVAMVAAETPQPQPTETVDELLDNVLEATATPNPDLPNLISFTTDKEALRLGEGAVLRWDLENATEAFIIVNDSQEGVIAPGEKTVYPQANTTYTLLARNGAGEVSAQITIDVDTSAPLLSAPAIHYFNSSHYAIDDDDDDGGADEAILSWELSNATEAHLKYDDKERGVVSPGQKLIAPDHETEYILVARNDLGETSSKLIVTIGQSPLPGGNTTPSINSFSTTSAEINRGDSVTLRWDAANAREVRLEYDGNEEGVVSPGEKTVSPSKETRYKIVAHNDIGETVAELVIKVR